MPGPEPKKRVKANQQPSGGVLVPIARSQLEEMGVDPDDPDLEVARYVYNSDRAEARLRFYEGGDDD